MRRQARRRALLPAAAAALLLSLVGCASNADSTSLSDEDQLALGELAVVAGQDAQVAGSEIDGVDVLGDWGENAIGDVECWAPSESMVDATAFRVICRVHFEQAGEARYRDMICIGEFGRDPVADYCYPWAYYSDMPGFEDQTAYLVRGA